MNPAIKFARATFLLATIFLCTHCARHSGGTTKPMHGDGKAAIGQGPGESVSSRAKKAEREVPGLPPIVQAPGRNDAAMLR